MTTADALLAAVLATPDDNLVRLVYADYLEENGDPDRAEFIRVQCELEGLPEWEGQAAELRHRERVLLARHGRRWLAELPAVEGVTWGAFRRGFVAEAVILSIDPLLDNGPGLADIAPLSGVRLGKLPGERFHADPLPWLRHLRLTDRFEFRPDDFERLLESGFGEHLTELDLRYVGVENPGAEVIARLKGLKRLRKIDFTNCFVGVAGVEALAGAKHLAGLTNLVFDSHGSGYVEDPFVAAAGAELLADSPTFANLTELGVGGNRLTGAAVRRLLSSRSLAKLERVSLTSCQELDADAFAPPDGPARWKSLAFSCWWDRQTGAGTKERLVQAIARCPQLSALERLTFSHLSLTPAGVAALAASPMANTLRELTLRGCEIGPEAALALAEGRWPKLVTLKLSQNRIGKRGAEHLGGSTGFPSLRALDVRAGIGTDGAARLLAAPWAAGLRELDLGDNDLESLLGRRTVSESSCRRLLSLGLANNKLTPAAARAVCTADLPELTDLSLSGNPKVGDAAAAGLSASGRLDTLVTLGLGNTGLTGVGMAQLTDRPAPQLGRLDVSGCPLGEDGAAALAAAEWPALRDLSIMQCGLTADAMAAVAAAPFFDGLGRVGVYGNTLPTRGPAAGKFADGYWVSKFDPTWVDGDRDDNEDYY